MFLPRLSLKGLRPYQGCYRKVHNHCEAEAQVASINLISANKTRWAMAKSSGNRIFVIDIQEWRVDKKFGEDKSVLADLGKWRVQIWRDFDDLFPPLCGIPPPGDNDFRIHNDRTAKIPHRQCQDPALTTPCCSTGNGGSVLWGKLVITLPAYSRAARSHTSGLLRRRS